MRNDVWRVREADYPARGSTEERLRYFLRYAVLAPSGHNTQPWRFQVADGRVWLYADRGRRLPVADPDDRELTISCGAALFHLRLAMRFFGQAGTVEAVPDPADPDLLAVVHPAGPHAPDDTDRTLFAAIPRRFTHRAPFRDTPVPPALKHMLQWLAEHEGAGLHCLSEAGDKEGVADLVAEGDRRQGGNPAFRRELARWVTTNYARRRDGLPGYTLGVNGPASLVVPAYLRWANWGEAQARRDRELVHQAPALAALTIARDGVECWLAAGQALAAVLLRAAEDGVQAAYLNQAVAVPELRQRLRERLGVSEQPQVLMRLGYETVRRPPAPRRPLAEVLD
jgi:nitroreductase